MTSMNFPTLPYDTVTNSFLLEICFWGPTYPTFLYDVTLFTLFFWTLPLDTFVKVNILFAHDLQSISYKCNNKGKIFKNTRAKNNTDDWRGTAEQEKLALINNLRWDKDSSTTTTNLSMSPTATASSWQSLRRLPWHHLLAGKW